MAEIAGLLSQPIFVFAAYAVIALALAAVTVGAFAFLLREPIRFWLDDYLWRPVQVAAKAGRWSRWSRIAARLFLYFVLQPRSLPAVFWLVLSLAYFVGLAHLTASYPVRGPVIGDGKVVADRIESALHEVGSPGTELEFAL